MSSVPAEHTREHRVCNEHRCDCVDVDGACDLVSRHLVECLVAGHDSRAVDEDVHLAAVLDYSFICVHHCVVARHIHSVAIYISEFLELLLHRFDRRYIYIPDDEISCSFFQGHTAHNLADSGCTTGDQHVASFNFHNLLFRLSAAKIYQQKYRPQSAAGNVAKTANLLCRAPFCGEIL